MFLVLQQNSLLLASEFIEAPRFNNYSIMRGMDALSNRIKHQFANDLPQFTMLASTSVDQNEIILGFKQRSNVQDVAIEHLHVYIGQNQRIKESIFSSSLNTF